MHKTVKSQESKEYSLYIVCFLLFTIYYSLFTVSAYAQTKLKTGVPDLCYKCHVKLKESLLRPYVHFPFKDGRCTACHNSHTSDIKNLLNEEINSLCLGCHKGIKDALKKVNVHTALKKGACTDCHYAHSGGWRYLLVKDEKSLCGGCHETLKEELKKPVAHAPFKDGKCSACHDAHASSEENQLLAPPNKICKSCHAPRCKAGGVSISFATEALDCTSCHTGHNSNTKGLLGNYGHPAFLNKDCGQCHNPIVANRRLTTRLPVKDLCFTCHEKDPAKFREGDVHLSEKGGCGMCHIFHASSKKNLTVKEGRLCFGCHKGTEKRITLMIKTIKRAKCISASGSRCFECHIPLHSSQPYYFRGDKISTCARCHEAMHKVSHPLGPDALDPRNGQPITCITCHGMHSAKAEFMLHLDRKRPLCIQCHKR